MSVSVDWKPERAVQAKVRDIKNIIILIGWNPKREIYAKVKDHDKVTASVRHVPLGASGYQKTSDSNHLQIKDSKQGQFKVVRENNGYMCSMYLPIIFTIFQFFFSKIGGATLLAGYHSIDQIWACARLFGTLIHSTYKIPSIFYGNTWSENFQNTKTFFYIFWKVWITNTLSLNSWVKAYISIRLENGYIPEENTAKHCGEYLCFEQDAAAI